MSRPNVSEQVNREEYLARWGERIFERIIGTLPVVVLGMFVALPVLLLVERSLRAETGEWVGWANYARYFSSASLMSAAVNSVLTAGLASVIGVGVAFVLAYGLVRSRLWGRGVWRQVLLIPLYAPTMLVGLALVYVFGRQGLVTQGLFGRLPGVDIGLYGFVGIVIAEALMVVAPATLMISNALLGIDGRLDEAARSMGAGPLRRFMSVTWPAAKFGVLGGLLAGFVLCFTDFGAPKVVGGMTTVLPVQVYQQVVGQQNLAMGSTVAVLMLVPVVACFALRQALQRSARAGEVTLDGRSVPIRTRPSRLRDALLGLAVLVAGVAMLLVVAVPAFVSVVNNWPYSLSGKGTWASVFTLRHFDFSETSAVGGSALWNSVWIAAVSAVVGTVAVFVTAYAVEKLRGMGAVRSASHVLAMAPLAMPGLVIGLAYVFLFNRPEFLGVANPLSGFYGTAVPLVVANVIHFFSVAYLTTLVALRQQDRAFEEVGASMGVPRWRLMGTVTLPVSLPALIDVATYLFVNSMCTVSAVIFLYSPGTITASVAVVGLEDAGEQQAAAALCVLIFGVNVTVAAVAQGVRALAVRVRTVD